MLELRDVNLRRPEEEDPAVHTRHNIVNRLNCLVWNLEKKYRKHAKKINYVQFSIEKYYNMV